MCVTQERRCAGTPRVSVDHFQGGNGPFAVCTVRGSVCADHPGFMDGDGHGVGRVDRRLSNVMWHLWHHGSYHPNEFTIVTATSGQWGGNKRTLHKRSVECCALSPQKVRRKPF
eukprot:gene57185-biopygen42753